MAPVLLSTGSIVIGRTGILGTDVICDNLLLYSHTILEGVTRAQNKLHLLDTTGEES